MLPNPIGLHTLKDRSFSRDISLPQVATLQQLQAKATSSGQIQLLSSMEAKLSYFADTIPNRVRGLRVANCQQPGSDWSFPVIVEYKAYANPLGPRGRSCLDNALVWKERAQGLATLLNKVPAIKGEASNVGAEMDDGYGGLDLAYYTFQCIGYNDEPSQGRLALIY